MLCIYFILLRYSLIVDQPILIEFKQKILRDVLFIHTNIQFAMFLIFLNSNLYFYLILFYQLQN